MEYIDSMNKYPPSPEPRLNYNDLINRAKIYDENKVKGKTFYVEGNMYYAIFGNNGSKESPSFIYVKKKNGKSTNETKGPKLHASVDPEQMHEAWDIIKQNLIKHGVCETKFANPLFKLESGEEDQEPGKEITIYMFVEDRPTLTLEKKNDIPSSWEEIIQDITKSLAENGIRPGAMPTSNSGNGGYEHQILGTNYITWRDDHEIMEDVRIKSDVRQEDIPEGLYSLGGKNNKEEELNNYLETTEKLPTTTENYDEHKRSAFIRYYEEIINFNAIGRNLMENQIAQQDRLDVNTHLDKRTSCYKDIQSTQPYFISESSSNETLHANLFNLRNTDQNIDRKEKRLARNLDKLHEEFSDNSQIAGIDNLSSTGLMIHSFMNSDISQTKSTSLDRTQINEPNSKSPQEISQNKVLPPPLPSKKNRPELSPLSETLPLTTREDTTINNTPTNSVSSIKLKFESKITTNQTEKPVPISQRAATNNKFNEKQKLVEEQLKKNQNSNK